jgi:DNA modification methylase
MNERHSMSSETVEPPPTRRPLEPLVLRNARCVVSLYLADCLDLLPIEADAVVSDPPYGMNWNTDSTRFATGQRTAGPGRNRDAILGDDTPFDPSPWLGYDKVVLWGSNHYAQRLPIGTTLVWLKRLDEGFGSFLSDAEIAWMRGGHGVYAFRKCFPHASRTVEAGDSVHPSQKPVVLMSWCLEQAKVPEGATVLDPFMGSGSTGVACIRTGRNFIGVEKDERYFEIAADRLRRELEQGRMF